MESQSQGDGGEVSSPPAPSLTSEMLRCICWRSRQLKIVKPGVTQEELEKALDSGVEGQV